MSNHEPILEGQILTGALFSEPMRVETVRPNGPDSWRLGLVGTRSERFRNGITDASAGGRSFLWKRRMMNTIHKLSLNLEPIPVSVAWYLSDLGEARGKHDFWPHINYLLFILKSAYREFEDRVGQIDAPRGAKTELITRAIRRKVTPFRVSDLQRDCPGVSIDLIRRVLKRLRSAPDVECLGRGQNAAWQNRRQ